MPSSAHVSGSSDRMEMPITPKGKGSVMSDRTFRSLAGSLCKGTARNFTNSRQFEMKHGGMSTTSLGGIPAHVYKAVDKLGRSQENSYRMEPLKRFQAQRVQQIISGVLKSNLGATAYSALPCANMAKALASDIKARVKQLNYKRYKILCHVTIGQMNGQSMRVASNCLWDKETDSYATGVFQNNDLFAVGTVYALFTE